MYSLVNEENYSDGQIIFKEGSSGDWVYVIISGSVEISRMIEGKKYILAVLREGDVFGEMAFLGNTKRTATATAVNETTLGIIDRNIMDNEFNKLSSGLRSILVTLVDRFRSMLDRVSNFTARKDPRPQKSISVSYKDKKSFIKAYTSNISKGGLFIKTENPLQKGERLTLKINLPDLMAPINVDCIVAWSTSESNDKERPAGMGLQFKDIGEKNKQILNEYLKSISI